MRKRNWSYLAGIFDGEGCLHIAKLYAYKKQIAYRMDIHITNTSRELVQWLVSEFGGKYYFVPSKNLKWKDAYRWVPSGKKNKENFILGMLPYLIIKRELAKICLEFLRLDNRNVPEKREEIWQRSRVLSRRGRSVETNTSDSVTTEKIESELIGDDKSAPLVMAEA